MDRLQEMEVFVAIVEAGSFAKAADRMRMSPPAVSRAMSALEDRLGTQLLVRTTRSISLTESGRRYLDGARPLLADLERVEREAAGETANPQGVLTLSASVALGRLLAPGLMTAFMERHPKIELQVIMVDRVVNLVEEGIDVALRAGELPDSTMIARRVGTGRRVLVASPDYLARHGVPQTPADLKHHAFIALSGLMPNRQWRHVDGDGTTVLPIAPRVELNDSFAALEAAERGAGITIAMSYLAADRLRQGRLVLVLDRYTPPPVPVQVVYPQSRIMAPKLRAFVDFAVPWIRDALGAVDVPLGA